MVNAALDVFAGITLFMLITIFLLIAGIIAAELFRR